MPPSTVVKNLLIINVLFFISTAIINSPEVTGRLVSFYPGSPFFFPTQIITHMFMHADFGHLIMNMIGLYFFGTYLERHWGGKRFLVFYMITGLGAYFLFELVEGIQIYMASGSFFPPDIWWNANPGAALSNVRGASGAVYGLLAGFAICFPHVRVQLLFPPIPMKARTLAIVFGGIELFSLWGRSGGNVAHIAHLGGMLFAFLLLAYWKKKGNIFY